MVPYWCHDEYDSRIQQLAGIPYTSTAKRYTSTYTRMRMELDHEKLDVHRAALDLAAYGNGNGYGYDGHSGQHSGDGIPLPHRYPSARQ